MNILVPGAGVVGSLYAARLKQAGNDVTVLAGVARWRRFVPMASSSVTCKVEVKLNKSRDS